nr:coiled-coil domain-containing protein 125 [Oncorhynchus nerka]
MEEALLMADAFRIAFEQQLRRRSDHFLILAETDRNKSRPLRPEGKDKTASLSVAQRLRGLLPSSTEITDDPTETLHKLLDLLSDKEEALAHQRKVSFMLARNTEELERRLKTDNMLQTQVTSPPHCSSETDTCKSNHAGTSVCSSNHVQERAGADQCHGGASSSESDTTDLQPSEIQEAETEATALHIQGLSLGQSPMERGGREDHLVTLL